ncbi:MAG: YigZ family protein [Clostridia bacterium]|nr:YigZ family protein [Clostridia bacterium]
MSDAGIYKTILKEGNHEFVINKSRFIGYGCPCSTEEEALGFIHRIQLRHRDATHNCYAYIIGQNSGIMRYSDDGEPGGTAGMPILDVIRKRGIVNCAVVVTRYFGGVLLGAGGLVRAYTQGSKEALDASCVILMTKTDRYLIEVDYSIWQRLSHYLRSAPVFIEKSEFETSVISSLLIRTCDTPAVLDEISRISDGRAEFLYEDSLYYPWPAENEED